MIYMYNICIYIYMKTQQSSHEATQEIKLSPLRVSTAKSVNRPGTFDSTRLREDARIESTKIVMKQLIKRDELKYQMLGREARFRQLELEKKKERERLWQVRTHVLELDSSLLKL